MAIDLNDLANAIGQLILRFRMRRRAAADWLTNNEVLLDAEFGYETDTRKLKIGDGEKTWTTLEYFAGGGGAELASRNAGTGIQIIQFQPTTGGGDGDSSDDADFANVVCVIHFEGTSGDTTSIDNGPLGLSVAQRLNSGGNFGGTLSTTVSRFGTGSMTGRWGVENNPAMNLAAEDWIVEGYCYPTGTGLWRSALLSIGDNSAFRSGVSPNYLPEALFIVVEEAGIVTLTLTDTTGTQHTKAFAWDQKSGSTSPFGHAAWTYWAVQRHGNIVTVYGGDRQLYINEFSEPGASSGIAGRYEWDVTGLTIRDTTEQLVIGGIPSDTLDDNSTWTFVGNIDEVRLTTGVSRRTSAGTGVLTVSAVANNDAPTTAFPSNVTPVSDDGEPYPIINNTRAGIVLSGAVDIYAHLPTSGLTAGNAYLNWDDNLVYVWSGSAFPADGMGLDVGGGESDAVTSISSSSGALTLDCGLANFFTLTLTEDIATWNILSVPDAFVFKMNITQDAGTVRHITMDGTFSLLASSATGASHVLGGTSLLEATTYDAGGTWYVDINNDPIPAAGSGGTDVYFSDVVLLLHFDGANAATTTIDNSGSPLAITVVGTAQLSSVQAKFGPTSTSTGSGSGWRTIDAPALRFGTGDFTVEGWFYPTGSGTQVIFEKWASGATGMTLLANSPTAFLLGIATTAGTSFPTFATGAWVLNDWNHVALCRVGTTLRLFINGTQAGADVTLGTVGIVDTTDPFEIGYNTNTPSQSFTGYVDEFRVTKGIGRYTAPFTPPALAFPNS